MFSRIGDTRLWREPVLVVVTVTLQAVRRRLFELPSENHRGAGVHGLPIVTAHAFVIADVG